MKKEGRTATIRIAGSVIPIGSPVSEIRLRQIESYINAKIDDIRGKGGRMSHGDLLTLALLSITDELFDTRDEQRKAKKEAAGRIAAVKESALELKEFVEERLRSLDDDEAG